MKSIVFLTLLSFAAPVFACTTTVAISQSSRDFAEANSTAENMMDGLKAGHIVQQRSSETEKGNAKIFCFKAATVDDVDLIRLHLKAVMAPYRGVSISNGSEMGNSTSSTTTVTTTQTCKSPEVQQAIHSCFDHRPNCPLSPYCSWAYDWYDRCSTRRPNRFCP